MWRFLERFWTERSHRRLVLVFGGPAHTYKLTPAKLALAREERNNL